MKNIVLTGNNRFFLFSLIILGLLLLGLRGYGFLFFVGAVTMGTRCRFISELFKRIDEECKKDE